MDFQFQAEVRLEAAASRLIPSAGAGSYRSAGGRTCPYLADMKTVTAGRKKRVSIASSQPVGAQTQREPRPVPAVRGEWLWVSKKKKNRSRNQEKYGWCNPVKYAKTLKQCSFYRRLFVCCNGTALLKLFNRINTIKGSRPLEARRREFLVPRRRRRRLCSADQLTCQGAKCN